MTIPFPPSEGWPTTEQELLLKSAFLKNNEAVNTWKQWRSLVRLQDIDVSSQSILPLAHKNVQQHSAVVDTAVSRYIKTLYLKIYTQNRKLFTQITPLLTSFQKAGFQTLILKGAALAHLYYPDIGFRYMVDVDLLIPSQQVEEGLAFLQQHGWSPAPRFPEKFTDAYVQIVHGYSFYSADGRSIDLHWHVMHECCQPDSDSDFWDHTIPFNFQGIETLALCPADQLLHLCVHSARFGNAPLRWVTDMMVILRNPPSQIDWDRLVLQAKKRRLILPIRETLAYVKERFDAPVPEEVLNTLDSQYISRFESFEYRYKRQNYKTKPLGYLPILWFDHCRLTGSANILRKLWGFPRYIQRFWGCETLRQSFLFLFTALKKRVLSLQKKAGNNVIFFDRNYKGERMLENANNTKSCLQQTKFPDFVIVGAQKSGTSFLARHLNTHPHITVARKESPPKNELHFFDNEANWEKGVKWYRSHFLNDGNIWGEKTPKYLYDTSCHARMYASIPQTKLIAILRNPVTRAYSQWKWTARRSHGKQKDERIDKAKAARLPFKTALRNFGELLERGVYVEQLESLLRFYPKEQVLILISERVWKEPQQSYQKICRYLEVPLWDFTFARKAAKAYRPMGETTKEWLYEYYQPYNERLFELLGYDIPEWQGAL